MRILHKYFQSSFSPPAIAAAVSILLIAGHGMSAEAEEAQKRPQPSGSPLDTLMHTRIWADVPEARDFVRENRPAEADLEYQPLTGTDPERPKVKTKAEIEALQAELEGAGARNEKRAGLNKTKPAKAKPLAGQ